MSNVEWLTARPIAHRGLHDLNRTRWENTLSAFQAAVDAGHSIECDVHLSSDGVPMVFHDHALRRLTGQDGTIAAKTAAELGALKVGETDDHVPTLQEMLRLVGGRAALVIELKASEGHDAALVERVAEALKSYSGRVALMSFEHRLVRQLAELAPDLPRGLTAEGRSAASMEAHFSMLAHEISFVSYAVSDLPNPFVSFVRERLSMPVITWTVRDREAVTRTFAYADQMTYEGFSP
ncbi:glycerophosphodiester phosphodiesterase [Nitratireductor kimnyeongensis]|uniref:Glycerophosphodiester phosphodiesterase n=1 Tax=Nitratireductor kimnyeongensis TaxID=430679 RepID=A0ABW0T2G5_9HYPH|nr:glycerophosphodiester phosphodiesterase [Nitratireductor kimnyeongensis]QZZ35417.1 glycerophosphodiester phosphodiesterase [Nitratireductor kimnyeongensis]